MAIRYLTTLLTVLIFSGCSGVASFPLKGDIYTNVVLPYSTDFRDSPVGSKRCVLDEHQLREPLSGYGVTVEWTAGRIMAAAKAAGISRISYTEMQTLSFMMGIYRRQRLIIYGD